MSTANILLTLFHQSTSNQPQTSGLFLHLKTSQQETGKNKQESSVLGLPGVSPVLILSGVLCPFNSSLHFSLLLCMYTPIYESAS